MGQNPTKPLVTSIARKERKRRSLTTGSTAGKALPNCWGVSPSTLADYELGITKVIPVDVVVKMAEVYNAPELMPHYCHNECPLGDLCYQEPKLKSLDRAVIQLLASLRLSEGAERKPACHCSGWRDFSNRRTTVAGKHGDAGQSCSLHC